jgi:anti-repressor protein
MMEVFENQEFGSIRVLQEAGKTFFCASDVAKALGYVNPYAAVKRHCRGPLTKREGVVQKVNQYGDAGEQVVEISFITEGDVYRLIVHSKLPSAERFEHWVFDEVLPSIRKHGAYMTNDTLEKALTSPDFLIQLATNLKEEQRKRIEAERKVTEAAPAVAFTNAVQSANSSCLIGELAKLIAQNGYSIGEKRLFAWMRDNGYLGKHGERYNIPNQQYVEQGLFELKKGVRSGNNGVLHTTITPKVTGKGQVYFVNKFLGNKEAC